MASLCDEEVLVSFFTALLAVKVFLDDAVGIIGKLAAVLWTLSAVWQKKPIFRVRGYLESLKTGIFPPKKEGAWSFRLYRFLGAERE